MIYNGSSQGQGGSSRGAFGLRYAAGKQTTVHSQRAHQYRKAVEQKAQLIADGKDPAEMETQERIAYQYCGENYDKYVANLSKRQEQATNQSTVKQAIIQKMYGDVIVGKYYNLQMRGEQSQQ